MILTILKTLLFTILLPGSVTAGIPCLLLSSGWGLTFDIGNWRFIGVILIALAIAVYIWTARDFIAIGKGTPAPVDPPRTLVARGLYRIVRNPMYIGVLLALLGEAIFLASLALLVYTIVIWLAFHLFVVYYEEPKLRRQFGLEYDEYCQTVSRWIPGLPHDKKGI